MRICRYLAALVTGALAVASAPQSNAQWTFQGLGILEGDYSRAYALSADGSVVVGAGWTADKYGRPFRWEEGVMVAITSTDAGATAVSADGSVVTVYSTGRGPLRWQNGVVTELPLSPMASGYAQDLSPDGSVAVGHVNWYSPPPSVDAAVWEPAEEQGAYRIVILRGLSDSYVRFDGAYGVSADGWLIVGSSQDPSGNSQAVYWNTTPSWRYVRPVPLGTLGGAHSGAYGVSADGSVIVGWAERADGFREAFRWENDTMVGLGILPGDWQETVADAVSADGSVIVGYAWDGQGHDAGAYEPFIWDQANGIRSLTELLSNHGIDLSDWDLSTAVDISADGRVIVGNGYHISAARYEGWIATIPEPSTPTALLSLAAAALLAHLSRRRKTES